MSRCHNYSFTNSLLISIQNENATLVKSFTDWKKDKVSINKNEKGIKIFCPVKQVFVEYQKDDKGRVALDENGEKIEKGKTERTTFKVGRVFDISQTNANRERYELKKESDEKILNKDQIISTLEKVSGIKINFKNSLGRANGLFNPEEQKIEIRANMGDIKTISTCVHEVAHSLLLIKIVILIYLKSKKNLKLKVWLMLYVEPISNINGVNEFKVLVPITSVNDNKNIKLNFRTEAKQTSVMFGATTRGDR